MKVLFLTGSHPRHMYIAKQLEKSGHLDGLIIEKREDFVPQPPSGLIDIDIDNYIRHFEERKEVEVKHFGQFVEEEFDEKIQQKIITVEELNSIELKQWIDEFNSDIVFSYGIHKLNNSILSILPQKSYNIHGGLSPWYRGNITLFWPFYFLKPNWAGMTIHRLTDKIDGGDILHHSTPELTRGDGIHDVACKSVKKVSEELINIIEIFKSGKNLQEVNQGSFGKVFNSMDWKPQHLRLIYNTFDNDIVDKFLDGELGYDEPKLIKAF